MNAELQHQIAEKATPAPGMPEWYFFVLILAVLVGLLVWKWLDIQRAKIEAQSPAAKASSDDEDSEKSEFQILLQLINDLRSEMRENMKHTEDKLAAFQRALDDGFRAIHKRMDDHLEGHGRRAGH